MSHRLSGEVDQGRRLAGPMTATPSALGSPSRAARAARPANASAAERLAARRSVGALPRAAPETRPGRRSPMRRRRCRVTAWHHLSALPPSCPGPSSASAVVLEPVACTAAENPARPSAAVVRFEQDEFSARPRAAHGVERSRSSRWECSGRRPARRRLGRRRSGAASSPMPAVAPGSRRSAWADPVRSAVHGGGMDDAPPASRAAVLFVAGRPTSVAYRARTASVSELPGSQPRDLPASSSTVETIRRRTCGDCSTVHCDRHIDRSNTRPGGEIAVALCIGRFVQG